MLLHVSVFIQTATADLVCCGLNTSPVHPTKRQGEQQYNRMLYRSSHVASCIHLESKVC